MVRCTRPQRQWVGKTGLDPTIKHSQHIALPLSGTPTNRPLTRTVMSVAAMSLLLAKHTQREIGRHDQSFRVGHGAFSSFGVASVSQHYLKRQADSYHDPKIPPVVVQNPR